MRTVLGLMTLAILVVSCATVNAQSTRNAELDDSDRRLNATYRELMRRLGPNDQLALRNAQRLWIHFRDADCAVGGGDVRDCLMQRTDDREKQLRQSIYFDARGALISLPGPE